MGNTSLRGFRGHMFDRDFFRAMKPGTLCINPGGGKSVVTADLVAAAGLDVTDPEALPSDHPLWSLHNVLITPHNSAPSGVMQQCFRIRVRNNLRRYTAGEPLLNVSICGIAVCDAAGARAAVSCFPV